MDGINIFQSPLSVRRATFGLFCGYPWLPISIHALREESDSGTMMVSLLQYISIHALREESDLCDVGMLEEVEISIHALREESDP